MRALTWALLLGVSSGLTSGAQAAERVNRAEDREDVAVAIYNDSLALIKETRRIDFDHGVNDIALRDVSARMRPETAALRAISGPPLRLIEQNFDFDLLTPQTLLDKYVGQTVGVIRTNPATGVETRESAQVLATNSGTVLKFADRIETGVPGRLTFPGVPGNLRDRPTLVVKLESATFGPQVVELSYLSGGLSWKADYVAELAADETKMDLAGWVTLTNQSGTAYENAKLQLVAGDVNRVQEDFARQPMVKAMAAPAPMREMAREEVFDYHLYTLGQPTTIRDNQTKQVALLSAALVPVRKEYLLAGQAWYYQSQASDLGQKQKIAVFLEFENAGGDLGKPLPKGVVRVYKKDSKGNAIFIGEDGIDHTAKNDKVRLKMGNAFDVNANRKQTNYKLIAGRPNPIVETAWRIEFNNAKDQPVTVKVVEPMPGDWEIASESQEHVKGDAHSAVWQVAVPAGGKAALEYAVRVR
ncbi:MAG TPA: DUF4139 domain-containing protein [Rhodocyclaceae bacterium]|nr:DUF4139 domain-containing protein [Rhodocyclaceae bacterium]